MLDYVGVKCFDLKTKKIIKHNIKTGYCICKIPDKNANNNDINKI